MPEDVRQGLLDMLWESQRIADQSRTQAAAGRLALLTGTYDTHLATVAQRAAAEYEHFAGAVGGGPVGARSGDA